MFVKRRNSGLRLVASKTRHTLRVNHKLGAALGQTFTKLFVSLPTYVVVLIISDSRIRILVLKWIYYAIRHRTLWAALWPCTTFITPVIHAAKVSQRIVPYLFVCRFVEFLLQLADAQWAFVIFTPVLLYQDIQLAAFFNVGVANDSRLLSASRSWTMWLELHLHLHLHRHLLDHGLSLRALILKAISMRSFLGEKVWCFAFGHPWSIAHFRVFMGLTALRVLLLLLRIILIWINFLLFILWATLQLLL